MQLLHPCRGSIHAYVDELTIAPDRYRPDHCPQCHVSRPLIGHGWYRRTVVDVEFDGSIRVRRYLCHACRRTVSLLPAFALPYLRFSISVISQFLTARLLEGRTLSAAAAAAGQPAMPYQRGQDWLRRFHRQAAAVCAGLAAVTAPPAAPNFVMRAVQMLRTIGWIRAHRFLLAELRVHLLGWPPCLAPAGRFATLRPGAPSG
jgi:hypothetical protein